MGYKISKEDWIISGVCAYVPQVFVWLEDIWIDLSLIIDFRLRGFGMRQSKVVLSSIRRMKNSLWILDNILFNLPYDEDRYLKTLEVGILTLNIEIQLLKFCVQQVCALIPDLDILEDGDESEIGERGVSFFFSSNWMIVFTMS